MRLTIHDPSLAPRAARQAAPVAPPIQATPAQIKARNLLYALRRWKREGYRLATKPQRNVRAAICSACPYWHPAGNLWLGECRAPGCGCTRAKIWLASEKCPLGKWARIE